MTKFFKSKMYKLIVIIGIIYVAYVLYNQQVKLNAYSNEKAYYEEKKEDLLKEKEELLEKKDNVNSPEYIEEMAREKLDMYLPNEKVFIDVSK